MFTLTIEHTITEFHAWKTAFDRFADARAQAAVLATRIRRPVDDRQYLCIKLDFETQESAEAFRRSSPPLSGPVPTLPGHSLGLPRPESRRTWQPESSRPLPGNGRAERQTRG